MPRPTIDYLNARRDTTTRHGPALAKRNAADVRAQMAALDTFQAIGEAAHAVLNDIRARAREDHNRLISRMGASDEIPF
jgi:hypothetical protein